MKVRFELKWNDMWIGAYWTAQWSHEVEAHVWHVWICFLPCLPLHIQVLPVAQHTIKSWLSPSQKGKSSSC